MTRLSGSGWYQALAIAYIVATGVVLTEAARTGHDPFKEGLGTTEKRYYPGLSKVGPSMIALNMAPQSGGASLAIHLSAMTGAAAVVIYSLQIKTTLTVSAVVEAIAPKRLPC